MFWPFHRHRDQIIAASCDQRLHWVTSQEHRIAGNFYLTHLTLQCERCRRLKNHTLVGYYTIEELRDGGVIDKALKGIEKASR